MIGTMVWRIQSTRKFTGFRAHGLKVDRPHNSQHILSQRKPPGYTSSHQKVGRTIGGSGGDKVPQQKAEISRLVEG